MIVTVTLNPSVDEEYLLDEIVLGSWSRANSTLRMPGGRGINVALMLTQLGYSAVAMGFLAGFNGEYIRDALRRANVTTNFVHIQGETRTNVYLSLKNPEYNLRFAVWRHLSLSGGGCTWTRKRSPQSHLTGHPPKGGHMLPMFVRGKILFCRYK